MKSPVVILVSHQLMVWVLLCALGFWHRDGLITILIAGLLWLVPNSYFTYYAFRYRGARNAPWIARSFYWGQSGKLILTIVGFALAFRFVKPLVIPVLFGAYGILQISHIWVARKIASRAAN